MYSALIGDALARWHRIRGRQTLFMTGTDEHGLKVQQAAEKKGLSPHVFCAQISQEFKNLFDKASISYDDCILLISSTSAVNLQAQTFAPQSHATVALCAPCGTD